MTDREAIEPLLADDETDRVRQRAAGVGAVVGAVLGSRKGPVGAGVSAGVGGAVGYIVGDLLGGRADRDPTPVDGDGPVEIDIDDGSETDETDGEA